MKTQSDCESQAQSLYETASNKNPNALTFLQGFHALAHEIDDFIDEGKRDPQRFLTILVHANNVYTMPFFAQHAQELKAIVASVTDDFAESLRMEKSAKGWERTWSDCLRFSGNSLVTAVAKITGGWSLMRTVSAAAKELSWSCHHDDAGVPV